MANKITRKQYEKLCESKLWDCFEDFHELLEQTTGIVARRYVGYMYYDNAGNYVGCNCDSVEDLLDNAYIKIKNN